MIKDITINKKKLNFILICLILILSIIPRLWKLSVFPPVIVDEPAYLRDIDQLIKIGGFYPANFQWDFSQATLAYYPTIFLIKFFKINNQLFALRLVSVIFSLLALIPFFFIVKRQNNNLIAFCVTILFSCSYFYLQFSRVGWGVIYATTLGLYLIWILESALEKQSKLLFATAGLFSALILYTYRAGEIYIAAGFLLLITKLFFYEKRVNEKIFSTLIFLSTFITISYPWINQIINNWIKYALRQRVVSVLGISYPYHESNDQISIFIYQITTTIKSWILLVPITGNAGNIENSRYIPSDFPPINFVLILFFWIGLIIALKNWRSTYVWLFIFFSGLLFGQVMTVHPPNGARALIILPAIYFFIALGLKYIYERFRKYSFISLIILVFSILIAISDFIFYLYWMSWIKV